MFWKVLQTWDYHTKHVIFTNHLIYSILVGNDNSSREIFQNCRLLHNISKVARRSQTTLQHFHPQYLSLRGVWHYLNLKDNYVHDKANLYLEALSQNQ